VRGLSNQLLERTAAGGAFTRWSRGRSTLIVRRLLVEVPLMSSLDEVRLK
jgi:hypothetical protein